MVKSPTDERQDTKPDVRLNLTAFRHHLEAENRSPNTIRGYVDAVERMDSFLADRGMPRTVATIHREHVEAFIADQLDRFQPATAANRYRSVKQFFRWLTDEGEISESPMVRFKGPKVDRVPADILRETDIAALQKVTSGTAFDDRRDRAIIELFYATGIRRAELAGLRLTDVDMETRMLRVEGKGATVRGEASKKVRHVPYDHVAAKTLDRYILRARAHHPDADSEWVWLGKKGRLTDNGIAQVLNRRGVEAGLGRVNPHRFRHTAAHELSAAGMQEGDMMRHFGWSSEAMPKLYGSSAADERAVASYRALRDRRSR